MITFKKGFHAVGGEIVFRVQPLRRVTAAAHVLGNRHCGTGLEREDLVFVMAARADRCVMRTGGHGLTVNARLPVARLLGVTRAAGFRLPREIERRGWGIIGDDLVRIVTIAARRRVIVTGKQRLAVDAVLETLRLPRVTRRAIHRRERLVIVGMFRRDVGVATDALICPVDRELEFGRIHEQRNCLPSGVGLEERVVAVTIETITVFQSGGRGNRQQPQQRDNR